MHIQEQHHYISVGHIYRPHEELQKRDEVKSKLAKEAGITLIIVPCWWDQRKERYAIIEFKKGNY